VTLKVVVLTGAGISAESGLRTFRASDGLWEEHPIEDVATPEAFSRDPDLVHRFYSERRQQLDRVTPNRAHFALAEAASDPRLDLFLVTQNVDDLHERAGQPKVHHMHGELRKMRCVVTGRVEAFEGESTVLSSCRCCAQPGHLRPHIVWFGEVPLGMDEIHAALVDATVFVSIGTSGNVYPAAGFVRLARQVGARAVELNLEPSEGARLFDEARYGLATEIVPTYLAELVQAAETTP
jgi:NAD-dependent deacetylase